MGKVSRALNKADNRIDPGDRIEHLPTDESHAKHTGDPETSTAQTLSSQTEDSPASEADGEVWDERLAIASENFSSVAESFRKLRTLILHPEKEKPARSILVVSANAQEGKSFVCANLGIRLAHGVGRHALIVDCDMRRPSLHNLFGLKNNCGLSDYLMGGMELPSLIKKTQLPKLTILPAGVPPDNPSELVASDKLTALMKDVTENYDDRIVVLDSPPLLAASETLILSQLVDKVVLVVRWGKSGREEVRKVVEQIGREKIIGVVFNAFEMNILDRKVQGVGYYTYYTESYY